IDTHMGWKEGTALVPAAERAALAAIRADREDGWAHLRLAAAYANLGRFDDSLAEFELALRLNPNLSLAQGLYGLVLTYRDRWKEGGAAARRALRLSPRAPRSRCAPAVPARAALRHLQRHCRLRGIRRTQLRRSGPARARGCPSAVRLSAGPSHTPRGGRPC